MVTHGIPDVIVSDNGSCFTSAQFDSFCTSHGIRHIRVSPYHPSYNGLAERAVQAIKEGLCKMKEGTLAERLFRCLTTYRNTPHATTGITPAELLMKRRSKTLLDLLCPNASDRVRQKQ
jgi:transposase InsO family protein